MAKLESKALHAYAPPESEGLVQAIDEMDDIELKQAEGSQRRDRGWLDGNDTQILPATYAYLGTLAEGAAQSKQAGIKTIPQVAAAESVGKLAAQLQAKSAALHAALKKANAMHDELAMCANFLTSTGAGTMDAARTVADQLELVVGDGYWPLPRYREMLFPV